MPSAAFTLPVVWTSPEPASSEAATRAPEKLPSAAFRLPVAMTSPPTLSRSDTATLPEKLPSAAFTLPVAMTLPEKLPSAAFRLPVSSVPLREVSRRSCIWVLLHRTMSWPPNVAPLSGPRDTARPTVPPHVDPYTFMFPPPYCPTPNRAAAPAGSRIPGNEASAIDAASVPDQRSPRFVADIEMLPVKLPVAADKAPTAALPLTDKFPVGTLRVPSAETDSRVVNAIASPALPAGAFCHVKAPPEASNFAAVAALM